MFDRVLIESSKRKTSKDAAISAALSAALHALLVGGIVVGLVSGAAPELVEEPIRAFLVGGGNPAPPPPPPPPPPGGSTGPSVPVTEEPETPEPEKVPVDREFVAPTEVPVEIPETRLPPVENAEGGVIGGVEGGVEGGEVGGVVGGVIGGVIGGTLGGTLGGTIGGTGTGTGPLRVGGNVQPPKVVFRVEPDYTEDARKARLQGIVIIEAIIDTNGNVTQARILKGLAGGLDQSALEAVRKWKFEPGRKEGKPVPVIFDLMVRFRLQ